MRLFTDFLRDYRNGLLVRQLGERLAKVQAAVTDTGKAGSITLTLKIKPEAGEEGAFKISASISMKAPERDLPDALYFANGEGGLLREPVKAPALFDANAMDSDDPAKKLAK